MQKRVPAHCAETLLPRCGGDSYRIQTCNLLIRSQMLYSVELRSRGEQHNYAPFSRLRVQSYVVFPMRSKLLQ